MKQILIDVIDALGFGGIFDKKIATENLDKRMLAAQDITNPNSPYMKGVAKLPSPYIFVVDVSDRPLIQRDRLAEAVNILANMGYELVSHIPTMNNGQVVCMRKR